MAIRYKKPVAAAILFLILAVLLFLFLPGDGEAGNEAAGASARIHRAPRNHPPARAPSSDVAAMFRRLSSSESSSALSSDAIEAFLVSRHRSSGSLLAAYRSTLDRAYLDEALAMFPDDPQVLLTSLHLVSDPGRRLELLERLEQLEPGNSAHQYLAARALFDLGRDDDALQKLLNAQGKRFDDHTLSHCQNSEELFLSAGLSHLESKAKGLYNHSKPEVMLLGAPLSDKLEALRESHLAAGDMAAVEWLRDSQHQLALQIQSSGFIVDALVGMIHEKSALNGLDTPEASERLAEIDLRRGAIRDAGNQVQKLMESHHVPESDWLLYFDRAKLFGEIHANQWLVERYPEPE